MASAWLRSDVALRCFFARNLSTTLPVVPMLPFGQGSGSQNNMAPSHVEIAIGWHWMLPSAKEQAAPEDCALIQTDSDRVSLDFLPLRFVTADL